MKLIDALPALFPHSSKATLKKWLKAGRILVDGRLVSAPHAEVLENAQISLRKKQTFIDLGIEILYEDRDLLVLNKPEGVLSVSTAYEKEKTVHGVIKKLYREVFPVHRIDRETSGILVFALSTKAREGLKEQFLHHTIYREYRAIVEGNLAGEGTWKHHLKEDANYFVQSHPKGDHSITHYKVLNKKGYTQFILETGRKNQIRAQAREAGHPIRGDQKYGGSTSFRLFLHAYRLEFIHPITQKNMKFASPVPFAS